MKYEKILLKVSGEMFAGEDGRGIKKESLDYFVNEIKEVLNMGIKIAILSGGGNFWRARDFQNLNLARPFSDEIGMMATVINALVLRAYFAEQGIKSRVFSAISAGKSTELVNQVKMQEAFENGELIIFAGGTSNPFFTTDSGAVLRALELDCQVIFKGTKVNGVFDQDPVKNPEAKKFAKISFEDALAKDLKVLDKTAFALALEKRIPLIVFDIFQKNALKKVIQGEEIGTEVF